MRPAVWGLVVAAVGCDPVEYEYHENERVDVFSQSRQRAVDLLLVIDNSCSMQGEQDHLADSFESLITALEGGDTDWRVAATTSEPGLPEYRGRLSGGTDEIVVTNPGGGEIDRVAYDDTSWTLTRGVPFQRCDLVWEPALARAGGSPGQPNPCGAASPTGSDVGPRTPIRGELVVNEFLPWSDGDDTLCEWIELANTTVDTLDLTGMGLRDDGRNAASFPAGTTVEPGGLLVVGRSTDRTVNCDTPVDLALPFTLAQGERWIDADTENAAEVFSELVAVGTAGFGLEMGMENALVTLSDPENATSSGGFLREEPDLALLFFSDEDDLSPMSVNGYIDAFRGLKGDAAYRETERVRFGAAVGIDPPGSEGTPCPDGEATFAARYVALTERTGGVAWSICGDLTQVADQAGITFSAQLLSFELSALPNLDTLVVEEYASEDEDSYLGPMVRDVDFVLENPGGATDRVRMVFPEDRVAPGAVVVVTYDALPASAELDLGSAR